MKTSQLYLSAASKVTAREKLNWNWTNMVEKAGKVTLGIDGATTLQLTVFSWRVQGNYQQSSHWAISQK